MPGFERIVLETTGLADPAPVQQTLVLDPMLRHQIRLGNTIGTVDALHGAAQLETHAEARLAALNPTARIIDAHAGGFDACGLILEDLADPATKLEEVQH